MIPKCKKPLLPRNNQVYEFRRNCLHNHGGKKVQDLIIRMQGVQFPIILIIFSLGCLTTLLLGSEIFMFPIEQP